MKIKSIIVSILFTLVSTWTFAQSQPQSQPQSQSAAGTQHSPAAQMGQGSGRSAQQNSTELSRQEQEDRDAATAKNMARAGRGKVTEGISPDAMMIFTHKCNSKYDTQMTLNRVGNLYRLMPRKLKREIGQVYYPALRKGLQEHDEMKFLEADAGKQVLDDGTLKIDLSFPKFYLTMDHVSWADLDHLFLAYFK